MPNPLDEQALAAALDHLDGWTAGPDGLTRTVSLQTFPDAIEAVRRVADAAERLDHHPDIDIRYRTVTFRCATHSAGGATTELDVALAGEIDAVLDAMSAG
jgi:4a-hydroxytetrahydrobiopterin dehydratase